jgi:TetR/AcrR family transcriptional regulator, transcriptional repressor of bet genes
MARRPYHREPEAVRQHDLIEATLDCIAEFGLAGATVREVALKAGVTPGLIRRYFLTKERLVEAAYTKLSADMTATIYAAVGEGAASIRLARFIRASLTAPLVDAKTLSLWAAFISSVNIDPGMAAIHRDGYRGYRRRAEGLIHDLTLERGLTPIPALVHSQSIAVNALIDGLWIEFSISPQEFDGIDVVPFAQECAARLLGLEPNHLKD